MSDKKLELIEELRTQCENLPHRNASQLDALKQRASMIVTKIFGAGSGYHQRLNSISFSPSYYVSGMGSGPYDDARKSGVTKIKNLLNTIKEDYVLDSELGSSVPKTQKKSINNNKVFIVHGHNETMKQSVARVIHQIGLEPIILHEQPNQGRTIIEKFTDYSDVSFAVVLLSGDDLGYSKSNSPDDSRARARQNVILELGFFMGKLGRGKVVALFEQIENFEFPSDYQGILYTPFDPDGKWKFDVARELKAAGFKIDVDVLI